MGSEDLIAFLMVYTICSLLLSLYNVVTNYFTLRRLHCKSGSSNYWYFVNCLSNAMTVKCVGIHFENKIKKMEDKESRSNAVTVVQPSAPVGVEDRTKHVDNIYEDFGTYYNPPNSVYQNYT